MLEFVLLSFRFLKYPGERCSAERQDKDVCYLAAEPHSFSNINGGGGVGGGGSSRCEEENERDEEFVVALKVYCAVPPLFSALLH